MGIFDHSPRMYLYTTYHCYLLVSYKYLSRLWNSIRYLYIPLRFQQSTYPSVAAVILPSEYPTFCDNILPYPLISLRSSAITMCKVDANYLFIVFILVRPRCLVFNWKKKKRFLPPKAWHTYLKS